MNRLVKSNVQLSDGTVLPAGARIMIAPRYLDPDVYEEPLKFDAYRFLRERDDKRPEDVTEASALLEIFRAQPHEQAPENDESD